MHTGQGQKDHNSEINNLSPLDARIILTNKILGWVVSIIESPSMRTLETRISHLVSGGWLPGKADIRTIAGLTNRSDRSIEELLTTCPRNKHHVGRQVFYRLDEFATITSGEEDSAEKPPTDAPAMRAKNKK